MSDAARTPEPRARTLVFVCHGPSCTERGSPETFRTLCERIAASPARTALRVCRTGCLDSCATGPNVVLGHDAGLRTGVSGDEALRLLDQMLGGVSGDAPEAASGGPGPSGRG